MLNKKILGLALLTTLFTIPVVYGKIQDWQNSGSQVFSVNSSDIDSPICTCYPLQIYAHYDSGNNQIDFNFHYSGIDHICGPYSVGQYSSSVNPEGVKTTANAHYWTQSASGYATAYYYID